MADIPDLSKLRGERHNARQQQAQPQPENDEFPRPDRPCLTAFVVFIDLDGTVQVHPEAQGFAPQRGAVGDDVYGACATVMKDIQAQTTAQEVISGQMQMAAQLQQRQQAMQVASQLDPNRLRT